MSAVLSAIWEWWACWWPLVAFILVASMAIAGIGRLRELLIERDSAACAQRGGVLVEHAVRGLVCVRMVEP